MLNGGPSERYTRATGVVARRVAGEMLLVPSAPRTLDAFSRAAELFVLNETGERMWEWLSEPRTVGEMARKLIDEYEVAAQIAQNDAASFIEVMRERGLVTLAGEQQGK